MSLYRGSSKMDDKIVLDPIRPVNAPSLTDIRIFKENKTYRVTDLILRKGVRWEEDRQTILSDKQYAGSILFKYLTKKRYENDLGTLQDIIHDHINVHNVEQPREDELVVHLRLGDVMDDYDKRTYDNCLAMYKNFAARIPLKKLPVDRATIVTAMHFGANEKNGKYFFSERAKTRSYKIAELVATQLVERGLDVRFFSHDDVDLDFCYMVGSHYFVKGQSKLSDLVVECLGARARHLELRERWIQRLAG